MSQKPTPGPWGYDGRYMVTIPHAKGSTSFRTMPEDARLIAAAPEMLEELEFLINHCIERHAAEYADGTEHDVLRAHEDAIKRIRSLVAKATGGAE